jgi:hypothetical protein
MEELYEGLRRLPFTSHLSGRWRQPCCIDNRKASLSKRVGTDGDLVFRGGRSRRSSFIRKAGATFRVGDIELQTGVMTRRRFAIAGP